MISGWSLSEQKWEAGFSWKFSALNRHEVGVGVGLKEDSACDVPNVWGVTEQLSWAWGQNIWAWLEQDWALPVLGVDCRKLHLINGFKHKLSARVKDGALSTSGAFQPQDVQPADPLPLPCPHPGVPCLIVKCFTAWFELLPGKNTSVAPNSYL